MNMMMMRMMMQRPLTAPMGHVGHTENSETVVESLGKRQKRSSTSELAGNLTSELARSVHGVGRSGHEPQSSSDRDGATMDHDYYGQSVSECVLQNSIVPNSSNSLSGCWRIYFGSASSKFPELFVHPTIARFMCNTLFNNIHPPQNSDWSQIIYTLLLKRLGRDLQDPSSINGSYSKLSGEWLGG